MNLRRPSILLLALVASPPASVLFADRLVLSGADFHSVNATGQYFEVADGSIVGHGGLGGTCLVAGVDLPVGATFTNMRVRYLDNDVTDFSVSLVRKQRGNSIGAEYVAHVDTFGVSAAIQEEDAWWPLNLPVHEDYAYYLTTKYNCLDSAAHRIYAVTIDYFYPIFADDFESGDTSAWGTVPSLQRRKLVTGPQFRDDFDPQGLIDPNLGTFEIRDDQVSFSPCGTAPVELPDGVTVDGFSANVYDRRSDRGLTLSLRAKRMSLNGDSIALATDSSSGSGGWQTLTDLSATAVINNGQFWYYMEACVTGGTTWNLGDLQVQAVEILYTLP